MNSNRNKSTNQRKAVSSKDHTPQEYFVLSSNSKNELTYATCVESPEQVKSRLRREAYLKKRGVLRQIAAKYPREKDIAYDRAMLAISQGAKLPFHFDVKLSKGGVNRPIDRFTIAAIAYSTSIVDPTEVVASQVILKRRSARIVPDLVHEVVLD